MRHEARLGPTTIHTDTRVLHWKPNGKLEAHGMRENPAKARTGRELLSARLFVGFNVGGKPRWTMEDVIRVTTEVRKGGASFLAQKGVYAPANGPRIEEDSAQVVIFNDGALEEEAFTDQAIAVAEALASKLEQDEVYLDIQKRGVTVRSYTVTPDVLRELTS